MANPNAACTEHAAVVGALAGHFRTWSESPAAESRFIAASACGPARLFPRKYCWTT
jgi:hypothetical protein